MEHTNTGVKEQESNKQIKSLILPKELKELNPLPSLQLKAPLTTGSLGLVFTNY